MLFLDHTGNPGLQNVSFLVLWSSVRILYRIFGVQNTNPCLGVDMLVIVCICICMLFIVVTADASEDEEKKSSTTTTMATTTTTTTTTTTFTTTAAAMTSLKDTVATTSTVSKSTNCGQKRQLSVREKAAAFLENATTKDSVC